MTARGESPLICVDADVLIYAASPGHILGSRVRKLFDTASLVRLCGSTLLLPEVLTKPTANGPPSELTELEKFMSRLVLWPMTTVIGQSAVQLGALYHLAPIDSVHLATAVHAGADAFLTNNTRDFVPAGILEIDVLTPEDLPA